MAWLRWLHWVNVLCGVLLIIAPFVLGYADSLAALLTSILLGLVVAVLSLVLFFVRPPVPAAH